MSDQSVLARLLSTRRPRASEAGIAALRVALGLLVATVHGWHKFEQGWRHLTTGTDWPLLHDTVQVGFPMPVLFATVAAVVQFVGGWLLALGAGTRIAAVLLTSTMCTAVVFNVRTGGPDAQLAGVYALAASAFVLAGGGRWSADRHLVGR